MLNPLSKFGYYQREIEQFRNSKHVPLRRIQLDPVSYCNHDCGFCIYRYHRDEDMNALFDKKDMIPFQKIVEILDDCQEIGVQAIELTGGGEPSLHPQFLEILQELNYRDIEIGLVTNGAWHEKRFQAIAHALKQATWVRFSLDAVTPETHRRTHAARKGDFDKAIAAIKMLVAHKTVDVGISFIVQQSNYHELADAYALAEELGVLYLRVGGVVFEGERIDHIELTPDQYSEAEYALKTIKANSGTTGIIDNFTRRANISFPLYNEGDTCYYGHIATVIGADAKMYACCIWKYRPEGLIADLNEKRLRDIYKQEKIRLFFDDFEIDKKCTRCFLKGKNDLLHDFVTAKHINFP